MLILFISISIYSQNFKGNYHFKSEPINAELIEYNLKLNEDFSYEIRIHRRVNNEYGIDEYFKGVGTWKQEKNKISFHPELSGEENEIDMTSVTARFDIKKKDELLFYAKKKMSWGLSVGMKKM